MSARKISVICVLALVVMLVGATSGLAYMRDTYGSVCSPLEGVPGLLQRANLMGPSPTCSAPKNGKCSGSCTLTNPPSGSKGNGTCVINTATTCKCVAP